MHDQNKNGGRPAGNVDAQGKQLGGEAAGALNSRRFSIFLKNLPTAKFNIPSVCDFFK